MLNGETWCRWGRLTECAASASAACESPRPISKDGLGGFRFGDRVGVL